MSWQNILGHDDVVEQFRHALAQGRLASTFLFVGPSGVGKRRFAEALAKTLLCQQHLPEQMNPCGTCESCRLFDAGNHPDFQVVEKPEEKSTIPVELFIGRDDRRMREGLCHHLSLKPFLGGRKLAVIDDADYLNAEGANSLLKTLEEPPPRSVLILIGTSADRQLPTIRSRAQTVRFRPLSDEHLAELLRREGLVTDETEAERLLGVAEGSLTRATAWSDPDFWQFRGKLLTHLAEPSQGSVRFAQALNTFVDEAGTQASARRDRARQALAQAAEFYRQLMRGLVGAPLAEDREVRGIVDRALTQWSGDETTAAQCLDRCLKAMEQVDRNANQATVLEAWLDDLARLGA
ncbi:MAG: DNA polymerase III subunit delta' [Pirellulales bacterium]|nr:DNA polymerase III subunit delta' [Pirellulales bacterium]